MVFLLPKNIVECIEKKTAHKTKESYRSSYDKKSHCFKISQISQIIFAQSWVNCMGFFHFVAWHFKWMSYYNVMDSAIVVGGGVRGNWLALRMCIGGIFRISARGISKKELICIFSLNNCAVLHGQQKAIKYRWNIRTHIISLFHYPKNLSVRATILLHILLELIYSLKEQLYGQPCVMWTPMRSSLVSASHYFSVNLK